MAGNRPSGSAPLRVKSSVWQIPVALISIRTSPAFGGARLTSIISNGCPGLRATAARVFILLDSFGLALVFNSYNRIEQEGGGSQCF